MQILKNGYYRRVSISGPRLSRVRQLGGASINRPAKAVISRKVTTT